MTTNNFDANRLDSLPDDGLGLSQIARRLGIGASVISNWKSRYADEFPGQIDGSKGRPLYSYSEVRRWIERVPSRADLVRRQDNDGGGDEEIMTTINRLREGLRSDVEARDLPDVVALASVLVQNHRKSGQKTIGPFTPDSMAQALASVGASTPSLEAFIIRVSGLISGDRNAVLITACSIIEPVDDLATLLDQVLAPGAAGRRTDGDRRSTIESALTSIAKTIAPERMSSAADIASGLGTVLSNLAQTHSIGQFVAYDIDDAAVQLATIRLLLRGIPARGVIGDSLIDSWPEKFDFVIAEPNIGSRPTEAALKVGPQRYPWGPIGRANSDVAWVQSAALSVAPGGVAVVVTSASSLADDATREARLALIADGTLRAIVTVPTIHHRSGGPSNLAIWVLGRDAATCTVPAGQVLFVHAEDEVQLVDALSEFDTLWRQNNGQHTTGHGNSGLVSRSTLTLARGRLYPWRWVGGFRDSTAVQLRDARLQLERGVRHLADLELAPDVLHPRPAVLLTARDLLRGDLERPLPVPRDQLFAELEIVESRSALALSTGATDVAGADHLRVVRRPGNFVPKSASSSDQFLGTIKLLAGDIVLSVDHDRVTGYVQLVDADLGEYVRKSSTVAVLRLTDRGRTTWLPEYLVACFTAPGSSRMLGAREASGERVLNELELEVAPRELEAQRYIVDELQRATRVADAASDLAGAAERLRDALLDSISGQL